MVKIYKSDGSFVEGNDSEVEIIKINKDDVFRLVNSANGVDIIMKDGSIKHINNAITDGNSITINS